MFRRVSDKPQGGARRECQASRRAPVLLMDEIEVRSPCVCDERPLSILRARGNCLPLVLLTSEPRAREGCRRRLNSTPASPRLSLSHVAKAYTPSAVSTCRRPPVIGRYTISRTNPDCPMNSANSSRRSCTATSAHATQSRHGKKSNGCGGDIGIWGRRRGFERWTNSARHSPTCGAELREGAADGLRPNEGQRSERS